jgi:hypothetical protein
LIYRNNIIINYRSHKMSKNQGLQKEKMLNQYNKDQLEDLRRENELLRTKTLLLEQELAILRNYCKTEFTYLKNQIELLNNTSNNSTSTEGQRNSGSERSNGIERSNSEGQRSGTRPTVTIYEDVLERKDSRGRAKDREKERDRERDRPRARSSSRKRNLSSSNQSHYAQQQTQPILLYEQQQQQQQQQQQSNSVPSTPPSMNPFLVDAFSSEEAILQRAPQIPAPIPLPRTISRPILIKPSTAAAAAAGSSRSLPQLPHQHI